MHTLSAPATLTFSPGCQSLFSPWIYSLIEEAHNPFIDGLHTWVFHIEGGSTQIEYLPHNSTQRRWTVKGVVIPTDMVFFVKDFVCYSLEDFIVEQFGSSSVCA